MIQLTSADVMFEFVHTVNEFVFQYFQYRGILGYGVGTVAEVVVLDFITL